MNAQFFWGKGPGGVPPILMRRVPTPRRQVPERAGGRRNRRELSDNPRDDRPTLVLAQADKKIAPRL